MTRINLKSVKRAFFIWRIHGKALFLHCINYKLKNLTMRYSTILRCAVACVALSALLGVSSCKSRQYVGPVNGKILKAEDLMKDDEKKSDDKPIEQVNTLSDDQQ